MSILSNTGRRSPEIRVMHENLARYLEGRTLHPLSAAFWP
jgi:hypothetical protein